MIHTSTECRLVPADTTTSDAASPFAHHQLEHNLYFTNSFLQLRNSVWFRHPRRAKLGVCHATDGPPKIGPPGPSVEIFLAIDGPPGPSMAAMDGPGGPSMAPWVVPPGHRWSPSRKSSRLVHDGPRGPPCRILQSSVSCSHVSVCWLRLLHAQGSYI